MTESSFQNDILERLVSAARPRVEAVEVNGQTFHLRGMPSIWRAAFLVLAREAQAQRSTVPDHTVVAMGLCQADGSPIAESLETVSKAIEALDAVELQRLAARVLALSGFALAEAKAADRPE